MATDDKWSSSTKSVDLNWQMFQFVVINQKLLKMSTFRLNPCDGSLYAFLSYQCEGIFQAAILKEKNNCLSCQLDTYRNKVQRLKQEQDNKT